VTIGALSDETKSDRAPFFFGLLEQEVVSDIGHVFFFVIPGKLAIAGATRNPGGLMSGFPLSWE
jgi:hypothetical protein